MPGVNRVPWRLLLPADRQSPVLRLGEENPALDEALEGSRVETSESAGPFAAVVRLPGGPRPADLERLQKTLLPQGYLLWISGYGERDGLTGVPAHRLRAGGRAVWSAEGSWARPLRGTGKVDLMLRLLRPGQPRPRYELALVPPGRGGGWIFELIEELSRRGVIESTPAGLGRIDRTETGAAIGQMAARDGTRLALKVALEERLASEMIHERSCLARLQNRTSLSDAMRGTLPAVLAADRFHGTYYRLERWFPGRPALELMYRRRERERIVDRAIEWITTLHRQTPGPPRDPAPCAEWARTTLAGVASRSTDGDREFPGRVGDYLGERLQRLALPTVHGHGDYWLGNVIHDPRSGAVTGVIDWNHADELAPPLEDVLHLLFHRKWLFSIYDPGARVAALVERKTDRRDRERIARYLGALGLDPQLLGPLTVLYWVRYLASREATLSSRRGWYERSYRKVREVLATRLGPDLDALGPWIASS